MDRNPYSPGKLLFTGSGTIGRLQYLAGFAYLLIFAIAGDMPVTGSLLA